uniref:AlNc14C373G11136 protein n=1 Tax=Albugo laibachii Nc14 TaxID=890382 RepID=F0WY76_9STRA|nr:AlNc14C373G11136 [Albugo laibachii Nc14]|eukprot:CCA26428.1 AlNc14C373G11136 [Albugo laibachii Nc14]
MNKAMVKARMECVHREKLCTSMMRKPAGILPKLHKKYKSQDYAKLSGDEVYIFQVEVAEIGAVEYNGNKNCKSCLYENCQLFYSLQESDFKQVLWMSKCVGITHWKASCGSKL